MGKDLDVVRTPRATASDRVAANDLNGVLRLKDVRGTPIPTTEKTMNVERASGECQ